MFLFVFIFKPFCKFDAEDFIFIYIIITLNVLWVTGSHDSATFDLDTQGGKADDFSSYLQISNDKLEKWFKTQHLDFSEQLKFGIRYMDLRIIKYGSGDVRFVHGLFSRKPVGFYLSGIRTFLEENPKEIVILDFNHVYEMQKNDHMVLCVEMNDIFKGMMVSKQKCEEKGLNPYRMTLQELWDIDGRVLILYKNARYCRQLDTIWSRDDIDILWPYTTDEDSVVTNLMDHYAGLYRKDALVVWQGILTPHADDDYAARMDRYKDLHEYVTPTTNTIASWVKQKPHISINIICADFVEEHEFVKTVVMANVM